MNRIIILISFLFWVIAQIVFYCFMLIDYLLLFNIMYIIAISILILIQIKKIYKSKNDMKMKVTTLTFCFIILIFALNFKIINRFIEKIDWIILYSSRNKIIEQIIQDKIEPQYYIYDLLYRFPVVSYGNTIQILWYNDGTVTVQFWVLYDSTDIPSFLYTNNNNLKKDIEKYIINNENKKYTNWKIKDNWYRLGGSKNTEININAY